MAKAFRIAVPLAAWFLVAALISEAHAQTVGTELDLGVASYKQGRYEDSIAHFKRATTLDPNRVVPHLYLGVAYAQQYVPGTQTPDNSHKAQLAIEEFEKVLTLDATKEQQTSALKSLASLYFNMKQLEKAKEYHRKVLEIATDDVESYYSIGVIDWTEAYQRRMEERAASGLKPDQLLINRSECWGVRVKNEDIVNDGTEVLTKAMTLRQNYDDAMAYMNLMYRERADIQCGNKQAYDADIKTADKWVDVTMGAKAAKERVKGANGVPAPNR